MDTEKKPLVILTGPTAVGKTSLSIKLAKACNGEIISADSMQVYKYMDIGTAKITKEEMDGVPHYLIDEFMPDEPFNVVVFQKRAKACIDDIIKRGKLPILVGGTGFYIQAVLYDIDFQQHDDNEEYRKQLEALGEEKGAAYLHQMLAQVDQKSAEEIHENNMRKVIRALEFYHQTGTKISEHNETQRQNASAYNSAYFVLNQDRSVLYQRIEKRIDQMLEQGLVSEVENLLSKGYGRELVSMQGLGYKEIADYLQGNIDLNNACEILKRDTRRFAKRQLTWFRREKDVVWLNKEQYKQENEILDYMVHLLKERKIIQ